MIALIELLLKQVQDSEERQPALVIGHVQVFLDIWYRFQEMPDEPVIIMLEQEVETLLKYGHSIFVFSFHEIVCQKVALDLVSGWSQVRTFCLDKLVDQECKGKEIPGFKFLLYF